MDRGLSSSIFTITHDVRNRFQAAPAMPLAGPTGGAPHPNSALDTSCRPLAHNISNASRKTVSGSQAVERREVTENPARLSGHYVDWSEQGLHRQFGITPSCGHLAATSDSVPITVFARPGTQLLQQFLNVVFELRLILARFTLAMHSAR